MSRDMTPAERERTLEVVNKHFPHFSSRSKDATVEMVRYMGTYIITFLQSKSLEEVIQVVNRFRRKHLEKPERPAPEAARTATAPATHSVEVVKELKAELKLNFEAPEIELCNRQEFMELRQGKLDLQAYAQKTQYLLSNIVYDPVPPDMQVTGFMKGLNDGPVKQSLYRHPPETLRDAIDMSIREEFSMRSASSHAGYSRRAQQPFAFDMPQRHVNNQQSGRRSSHFVSRNSHPRQSMGGGSPEPMDLSVAVASNTKQPKFKKNIRCNRCAKMGHFAHECMAPRPVPRSQRTEPSAARRHQQGHHPVGAKNVEHQ
ncbi:hypothetical protein PsorP6_000443 [Peronosclerospora sorghi]|uniref:Uncharacterized protein n=1 Tax=Peronosclerospora sorghi TaxID=230839 RepID=A0ACC0WVK9_9STRA|nr:hypothetical protein PsorP6_000443 [Peronosclerospora sorghi]